MKSGGLLGSKVSNFIGLFDTLKMYGIKATEVVKIIDVLPEFALQNRRDLIRRKVELIKKESGRDEIYMRNFIKRHPDVLLKSIASLEAKISYLQRNLNRQLKGDNSFPLILSANYNQVMRPRGDLLKDRVKHF